MIISNGKIKYDAEVEESFKETTPVKPASPLDRYKQESLDRFDELYKCRDPELLPQLNELLKEHITIQVNNDIPYTQGSITHLENRNEELENLKVKTYPNTDRDLEDSLLLKIRELKTELHELKAFHSKSSIFN